MPSTPRYIRIRTTITLEQVMEVDSYGEITQRGPTRDDILAYEHDDMDMTDKLEQFANQLQDADFNVRAVPRPRAPVKGQYTKVVTFDDYTE